MTDANDHVRGPMHASARVQYCLSVDVPGWVASRLSPFLLTDHITCRFLLNPAFSSNHDRVLT
jgi:hypothetical protein